MPHVEILKNHNEWRRGAETDMHNPKLIGESIDATVAEIARLRALEKLVQNLIDQKGRYNTEIAYKRLAEFVKSKEPK